MKALAIHRYSFVALLPSLHKPRSCVDSQRVFIILNRHSNFYSGHEWSHSTSVLVSSFSRNVHPRSVLPPKPEPHNTNTRLPSPGIATQCMCIVVRPVDTNLSFIVISLCSTPKSYSNAYQQRIINPVNI